MKTVDKALSVLDQFSLQNTEIGLSDLARMADLDKAATRRLLVALSKHGFIEQIEATRKYRLGRGFLRLARIREATVPIAQAAQEVADWLVGEANETVHVSLPSSKGMTTIAHRLPNRGHVVNIIPADSLPYHATASGLAYLSFSDAETAAKLLKLKREKITDFTVVAKPEITKLISVFRKSGYSLTRNTFELEVSSIAMTFGLNGQNPEGVIAFAVASADLTEEKKEVLLPLLKRAADKLTQAVAG